MLTAFSIVMLLAGLLASAARHPAFAIRQVTFQGDLQRVSAAHLRAIVAEDLAGTFFTLNLDRARVAFSRVPWVRDVSVRRRWPNQLEVELGEYRAFARWNQSSLVDAAGETFIADFDGELPQLRGPADSSRDVAAAYRRFAAVLAPTRRSIVELRLSDRRAWALRLDNGLALELGRDQADERLQRFVTYYRRAIAPLVRDEVLAVQEVDLRYRNGFAVRAPGFREAAPKKKV
jgi:cell division protein FtsQ